MYDVPHFFTYVAAVFLPCFLHSRSYTVRSRKLWNRNTTNTAMVKCILCSYKTNSISITKVKWVSLLCKVAVTHAH